jgi:hypothetical protein
LVGRVLVVAHDRLRANTTRESRIRKRVGMGTATGAKRIGAVKKAAVRRRRSGRAARGYTRQSVEQGPCQGEDRAFRPAGVLTHVLRVARAVLASASSADKNRGSGAASATHKVKSEKREFARQGVRKK